MKVDAVIEVMCPNCGTGPDPKDLRDRVQQGQMFKCPQCGRVTSMNMAVRVLEIKAG
jgi:uncharacterized Zn finger protein